MISIRLSDFNFQAVSVVRFGLYLPSSYSILLEGSLTRVDSSQESRDPCSFFFSVAQKTGASGIRVYVQSVFLSGQHQAVADSTGPGSRGRIDGDEVIPADDEFANVAFDSIIGDFNPSVG